MQMTPPSRPISRLAALPPWAAYLAAFGSGALAALAFEPVARLPFALLGSTVLLLLLASRPRAGFGLGFLFGFGMFATSLGWIATAFTFQSAMPAPMGWVAVIGLSAVLALFPAAATFAATRLTASIVPLSLLLAGLFVLTEILRGIVLTGFAWNPYGAAWLQFPGVASLAAIIGANGLSALVILIGGGLAALIAGSAGRWWLAALFPLLLAVGLIVQVARPEPTAATGSMLLLVQPNIGQSVKYGPGGFEIGIETLIARSSAALAASPETVAVIWPEGAVEYPLEEDAALRRRLTAMLKPGQLLLTGGVAVERDRQGMAVAARNSLYALASDGHVLARYDKSHLVPGGEYLPLRWLAEPLGLARLVPGSLDFLAGDGPVTWHLPGLPAMAPNICYEIIFPAAVVDARDRPGFVLTVSNDAWYGPSGPPQHMAQAQLRAIEEGLPVARVTPTGITGLIGPHGEIRAELPANAPGTLAVRLPDPRPATPFARLGLAAPILFAALLIALGAMIVRRKI